jgi:hypothetical protein
MTYLISWVFAGIFAIGGGNEVELVKTLPQLDSVITNNQTIAVLDETERFEQTYPFNANGKILRLGTKMKSSWNG